MEIKKKNTTILDVINKATIYKFLKDLTNHKQTNNTTVVFRRRLLPTILKYRNHRRDFRMI